MTWTDRLALFAPLDFIAVTLLMVSWIMIGLRIENPGKNPSVSVLMAEYRRQWMVELVTRTPRIFDATVLSGLRQATSFFASASMIALGGGFAAIGNSEQLQGVASELTLDTAPAVVWEIKIMLIMVFLTNAFLKFVWSNRLFGYCAVLMAAVPNDITNETAYPRAAKAASLNISAARAFNRGLRSVYFALGSAAWLLGSYALLAATLFTVLVLYRREFASNSRAVLMDSSDKIAPPTGM
ncbi:DUF599 domain-containing protein [Donghicola tyrosinivorans]|uniref:Putative membrane protein n=1 Tax=Donghicola tyrosinivorans TaxID=1652492 RepID=A0A2T0WZH2_9RHOB|nr:DUF599 domain-containing protein [Donghicola tyrosinivorans]PRY92103.1 putative membrane protein [Donghicola tyrosinivorans]